MPKAYRSLQAEGVFPDDTVLRIVFLNHDQAVWADDLSDLPPACRDESPALISPEDFLKTISSHYSLKGRLFSMPFNSSSPILYYNKDAFGKAGLPDAPPGTWKEVEAASRKILGARAARCGFTTSWPSWTMLENTFAWHDQPFAINANGYSGLDTRLLFNGRFGQMHVGALAAWQKDNIHSYGGRWAEADAKFLAGDCAMLVQSSAVIGGFTRTAKFPWGTGQLPQWGPPYPKANSILGGATLWALSGHAPREYTGIAKFLEFIAAPARQAWWAATTGYVPITTAAVKKLEEGDFFTTHPEQRRALSQLLNARPSRRPRARLRDPHPRGQGAIPSRPHAATPPGRHGDRDRRHRPPRGPRHAAALARASLRPPARASPPEARGVDRGPVVPDLAGPADPCLSFVLSRFPWTRASPSRTRSS